MKAKFMMAAMVILTFGFALTSQAAKWRVNNNPAIDADFLDIQTAHDNANAGDTLYIEGSGTPYGGPFAFYKKLVLIGPGYFLNENDSTQHNKAVASVGGLYLYSGSDGSVVSGLYLDAPWGNYAFHTNSVSNIIIKNCYLNTINAETVYLYYSNNIVVQQCFVHGNSSNIYISAGSNNILVQNNYFGPEWNAWAIYMEDGSSGDFYNNVIALGHMQLFSGTFRNNILCQSGHGFSANNVNITNNISSGEEFGCLNGNQCYVDMNNVFVCWNDCTGRTSDDKFMLLPTGVAIGAGYGGVDCGMFDGPAPYSLSGLTNIPAIWEMGVSGMNVIIKAKSH
jgi:hypothetical protein